MTVNQRLFELKQLHKIAGNKHTVNEIDKIVQMLKRNKERRGVKHHQ